MPPKLRSLIKDRGPPTELRVQCRLFFLLENAERNLHFGRPRDFRVIFGHKKTIMAEHSASPPSPDLNATIRRVHSDSELLDDASELSTSTPTSDLLDEASGDATAFSENGSDDEHGYDKVDFTDQFGGHFLEKLTDLWTRRVPSTAAFSFVFVVQVLPTFWLTAVFW